MDNTFTAGKAPLSCCSEALNLNKIILQVQKIRKQNSKISQKKEKVEVGRDFWRSSSSNFLLKQGHLAGSPGQCVQQFLSIYMDGDFTTSLSNLCQCSVILTLKQRFQMFRRNLLCFSLCPLVPKKADTAFITLSLQVFKYITKIPQSPSSGMQDCTFTQIQKQHCASVRHGAYWMKSRSQVKMKHPVRTVY